MGSYTTTRLCIALKKQEEEKWKWDGDIRIDITDQASVYMEYIETESSGNVHGRKSTTKISISDLISLLEYPDDYFAEKAEHIINAKLEQANAQINTLEGKNARLALENKNLLEENEALKKTIEIVGKSP